MIIGVPVLSSLLHYFYSTKFASVIKHVHLKGLDFFPALLLIAPQACIAFTFFCIINNPMLSFHMLDVMPGKCNWERRQYCPDSDHHCHHFVIFLALRISLRYFIISCVKIQNIIPSRGLWKRILMPFQYHVYLCADWALVIISFWVASSRSSYFLSNWFARTSWYLMGKVSLARASTTRTC